MFIKYNQRESFWSKVDVKGDNDCWNWKLSVSTSGYGQMRSGYRNSDGYKNEFSHRVAWFLTYGEIPDNLLVLHHCDNTRCCNPKHLFLGTSQDNSTDMCNKGRHQRGEGIVQSKLTEIEVLEIRDMYTSGNYFMKNIAKMYDVSRRTIGDIVNNKRWKHLIKE